MPIEIPKDKWAGAVKSITLGATAADGGTRSSVVTIGGEKALPFMHFEAETPHQPVVAIEIKDRKPDDWSPLLLDVWGDAMNDPAAWAKAAEAAGAELLQMTLSLTAADGSPTTPANAVAAVKAVLGASGLPLIVFGPGQVEHRQRAARADRGSDQGRAPRVGYLRGQELSHDRGDGDGERSPRHGAHGDGRQPRQAAQHPHQRHGPAARSRAHGPDDGRAGLRHRVRLLGDGASAHGGAARRRDDAAAHDRHASASKPGRPKRPKSAKVSRRPGATGPSAASTGKR